ncbi:unnamed protein product [Acanthosepion pharaonis]|uniref:Uncharacterized protein n=1 Tax=Acanthosepion pharaonis TaxID=158019 RepID=A0A812CQ84_ACAPH|nr:unnamed protein product [Sepia pharaonis]
MSIDERISIKDSSCFCPPATIPAFTIFILSFSVICRHILSIYFSPFVFFLTLTIIIVSSYLLSVSLSLSSIPYYMFEIRKFIHPSLTFSLTLFFFRSFFLGIIFIFIFTLPLFLFYLSSRSSFSFFLFSHYYYIFLSSYLLSFSFSHSLSSLPYCMFEIRKFIHDSISYLHSFFSFFLSSFLSFSLLIYFFSSSYSISLFSLFSFFHYYMFEIRKFIHLYLTFLFGLIFLSFFNSLILSFFLSFFNSFFLSFFNSFFNSFFLSLIL